MFIGLTVGCSLAPTYSRPEAPVPAAWPDGPVYTQRQTVVGTTDVSKIKWKEFFVDEKLLRIIDLALANNRDLRVAALNVERTRALYRIQRSELFPMVDAAGAWSKERVPGIVSGTGQPATVELYNVNLGISSWELDLLGRIRSLKDAALERYLATEQARVSAQISLVSEVANTYLTPTAWQSPRQVRFLVQYDF